VAFLCILLSSRFKLIEAIVFRGIVAHQCCLRLNTPNPGSINPPAEPADRKTSKTWGWNWGNEEVRGGGIPSQTGFITQSHHQAAETVPAVVCSGIRPTLQLLPPSSKLSPNILVTIQQVCPLN
jgi:hypothetical protein